MEFFMPNAMIGFSPESNWVTSKLPLVGGGNGHLVRGHDGLVQSIPIRRQSQRRVSGKQFEMVAGS